MIDKSYIRDFYKRYKTQILSEMREHLDEPLENLEKIDNFRYRVWEGEIEAIWSFLPNFYDTPNPYFNINETKKKYSLQWTWGSQMPPDLKTGPNFLRVLANGYQIITDFIDEYHPEVISFGGLTDSHNRFYLNDFFIKRLTHLVGDEYVIKFGEDKDVIYIIHKISLTTDESYLNKRSKYTSIQEAFIAKNYPHLHPSTPKNVRVKATIKQKVLKNIYFKNLK